MPLKDKERRAEYNRQYRLENKERLAEYEKEYYRNPENRLRKKKMYKAWADRNREHIREYHREDYKKKKGSIYKTQKRWYAKTFSFRRRKIAMPSNPRTGVCTICGNKPSSTTHLHHALGYFIIFPWFGLKELCNSCHMKITSAETPRNHGRFCHL